jgi:cyanophycinase
VLALVGGLEFTPGNEPHDRQLAASARAAGGPAYVIATAAVRKDPEASVATARGWFAALGLEVSELRIRNRGDATSDRTRALAQEAGLFYIAGGDPGLVAQVLRDTAAWEAIIGAWRRGAALAGSSAGAMALGRWTLVRDRYPGHSRRRYRDALGLVPRTAVLPHFNSFGERWIPSATTRAPGSDVVLLGLDERTAAVWSGGRWSAQGSGAVTVIDGGRVAAHSGDAIEGLPVPDQAAGKSADD